MVSGSITTNNSESQKKHLIGAMDDFVSGLSVDDSHVFVNEVTSAFPNGDRKHLHNYINQTPALRGGKVVFGRF